MKTLILNIEDALHEKAIISVLDALGLEYDIEDAQYHTETDYIMSNSYLSEKIEQGRKDMEAGKGTKIPLENIWKQ